MTKKLRVAAYVNVPKVKKGAKGIPLAFQKGKIEGVVPSIAKDLGFADYEITWFGDQRERGDPSAKRHEEHLRLVYYLDDESCDVVILFHESCGSTNSVAWSVLWNAMRDKGIKLYIMTRQLDLTSHRDKMVSQVDRMTVPEPPQ